MIGMHQKQDMLAWCKCRRHEHRGRAIPRGHSLAEMDAQGMSAEARAFDAYSQATRTILSGVHAQGVSAEAGGILWACMRLVHAFQTQEQLLPGTHAQGANAEAGACDAC